MKSIPTIFFSLILLPFYSPGQTETEISIPPHGDKYSEFVKILEEGKTDIDFKEFRESFIESEQFKIASKNSKVLDSLEIEMYAQMKKSNFQEIINITKAMLSLDYTSMLAHKILRQTYEIIKETKQSKKHKSIQFGLLNSIVQNGDGKTCRTAWPVIQIAEEYFILEMLGAKLKTQHIEDRICDKMEVKIEGEARTYYFDASKIFEGYKKLGMK